MFLNIFANTYCMIMIRCALDRPDLGQFLNTLVVTISHIENFLEPLEVEEFLKNG